MPFTYQDFHKSWQDIHDKVPSYRLGQYFCSLFLKNTTDDNCDSIVKGLWEKTGEEAYEQINDIIKVYQWDLDDLPIMKKELS